MLEYAPSETMLRLHTGTFGRCSWDMRVPSLSAEELSRYDFMLAALAHKDVAGMGWHVTRAIDHDRVPPLGERFGIWLQDFFFPFAFVYDMIKNGS